MRVLSRFRSVLAAASICLAPLAHARNPVPSAPAPAPSCSVTVQVATTDGGPAPAGLDVRLSAGEVTRTAKLAEDGSARFAEVPCVDWSLWVGQFGAMERFIRGPAAEAVWLVTVAAVRPLRIRVQDENGRPVGSGSVTIWHRTEGGQQGIAISPGPDGRTVAFFKEGSIELSLNWIRTGSSRSGSTGSSSSRSDASRSR